MNGHNNMNFTASNGITVKGRVDGGFYVRDDCHANSSLAQAIGEYIIAKEDERLGRWRWPENPEYLVHPRADGTVLILREGVGEGGILYRRGDAVADMETSAACAYFDAHPELDEDREIRDWQYTSCSKPRPCGLPVSAAPCITCRCGAVTLPSDRNLRGSDQ